MSYDPREHFQRIQRNLQSRGGANFGGGAGGPAGRGIVGLVLLAGVVAVGSNALFNGMHITYSKTGRRRLIKCAVDGGHRAIVYSRIGGVSNQIYSEGTHLRIPWIQTPVDYDVRARPRIISSLTGTKDLQMVCQTHVDV
jgi:prohibitin 2